MIDELTSGKTYFLYDGDQPVCEYTASGTTLSLAAVNIFGATGLVARHGASSSFYLYDERGNVAQRTGSTGTVNSSELYDAYGTRAGTVAQPDPFGFEAQAGYYTDTETGFVLCTNRYYDPAQGRFLTRDPIGYDGGINLYSYTENNPVNMSDLDGLQPHSPQTTVLRQPGGPYIPGVPQHPAGEDIRDNIAEARLAKYFTPIITLPWFWDRVHTGGDWDFKYKYGGFGTKSPLTTRRCYSNTSGPIRENLYDAYGNFNYGAIAAALGYPLDFALSQADEAHKNDWHKGPSHLDHGDYWIIQGYNWYADNYDVNNMSD